MPKNNGNGHAPAVAAERPGDRARRMAPVLLVVLAVLNALFFALALRPADARARADRETLRTLEDDLKARRAVVGRYRVIDSSLGEASREDAAFLQRKFLPRATGYSTIMEEVDKLGQETHVRRGAANYDLLDVEGHPGLYQVQIQTTLEGDYANIVEFINKVERDPLFLLIDQIAAAGGSAAPGAIVLPNQVRPVRLSIVVVTYFRD